MAERLRLPVLGDDVLVVELDSVHTVTGSQVRDEIMRFASETPVAVYVSWRYDCTCGEIVGADGSAAMAHIAEVRGHVPSPSAAGG